MHRIDGPGHVNNRWVAQDDSIGRPPTEFVPEFFNAFQEELCSFIEWAGLELNKNDNTQVRKALQAAFAGLTSPEFTGTPKAPTPAPGANTTQIATMQAVQTAVNGIVAIDIAGAATTALTADQAGAIIISLTGVVTAAKAVTVPAASGVWTVRHGGSGKFPVTFKTPAGTGIVLWPGDVLDVFCDGANVYARNNLPRVYASSSLPGSDVGPIIVKGMGGKAWEWASTAYFSGYRSSECGGVVFGHTALPRAWEVDAVGGVMSKTAYAALWAYAQENGLVVTNANWVAGSHWFVDLGGDNFMCPDLRNMFPRLAAGATDLDTANARALGSRQADALRSHTHPLS
ncbi:MAG: hypothetical protein J7548_19095, partial [Herbaspirillum sp.]|nr:hypothetical protein [Herbaspirillum sp.]